MFSVTAMGQFPPFADLTRWGLARALAESGIALPRSQQEAIAGAYRRLRPFDDARPALAALRERGHLFVFFFQAEDGIRDLYVTGVQTCALPISLVTDIAPGYDHITSAIGAA